MSNLPQVNVIIPTIGKDRMVVDLLQQICEMQDEVVRQVIVFDNGMDEQTRKICEMFDARIINAHSKGIYQMWNMGVKEVLSSHPGDYVAILNDDLLLVSDNFFTKLVEPLDMHDDIWATCGNYDMQGYAWGQYRDVEDYVKDVSGTFKDGGFAGFCFAVKAEAYIHGLPLFEEKYHWWYGDDDFVHSIHKAQKRTTMSNLAVFEHIGGGSQSVVQYTPSFNEMVAKDQEVYMRKWHTHLVEG